MANFSFDFGDMAGGYPEGHVWFKYNFFFHGFQRSCTCFEKNYIK